MKKINYILLSCCSGFLLINTAMAGTTSNIVQKSADVVFFAPNTVSLSLVPSKNLQSGDTASGTVLATANLASARGNALAISWIPTLGTIGPNIQDIVVTGKNNPQNTLSLELVQADTVANFFSGDGSWLLPSSSQGDFLFNDDLNIVTNGGQTINPDTYTIGLQAGVWTY